MRTVVAKHRFIDSRIPPGWHTTAQAAELVKVSPTTIKRWRVSGAKEGQPSGVMPVGSLEVNLYSDADIVRLIAFRKVKQSMIGRPRKEKVA